MNTMQKCSISLLLQRPSEHCSCSPPDRTGIRQQPEQRKLAGEVAGNGEGAQEPMAFIRVLLLAADEGRQRLDVQGYVYSLHGQERQGLRLRVQAAGSSGLRPPRLMK